MAALSVRIDEKTFPALGEAPAKRVLADVVLRVEAGETVAVIGPSGCGKTTLLNIAAGLDDDFDGRVERAAGSRLGYVFQEPRLLPWRTVEDNLRLVLDERPGVEAKVRAALVEVGLEASAGTYASRLSLGMARRVALARAFVIEPDLLFLDEPFVSVDEATGRQLRLLLLDQLAAHGASALFVTHRLSEAIMLADRLVLLAPSGGRTVAEVAIDLDPDARRDPARVALLERRLVEPGGLLAAASLGFADTAP